MSDVNQLSDKVTFQWWSARLCFLIRSSYYLESPDQAIDTFCRSMPWHDDSHNPVPRMGIPLWDSWRWGFLKMATGEEIRPWSHANTGVQLRDPIASFSAYMTRTDILPTDVFWPICWISTVSINRVNITPQHLPRTFVWWPSRLTYVYLDICNLEWTMGKIGSRYLARTALAASNSWKRHLWLHPKGHCPI